MQFILSTISGFIESIWRRWFGGWVEQSFENVLPKWAFKILASRGTQTAFNLIFLFAVFMLNTSLWINTPLCSWLMSFGVKDWCISAIMSIIFQFQFWSRGHGPAFDIGRGKTVDEDTVRRYQKVWYAFIPNKLIPEEHWYGFLYDLIWMTARYTEGTLLMIPFLWSFDILWLGLITSSVYALCWTIQERDSWVIKYIPWKMVTVATQLAELVIGFLVGFYIAFK